MSRTRRSNADMIESIRKLYDNEIERLSQIRRSVERKIYNTKKRRDRRIKWLKEIL